VGLAWAAILGFVRIATHRQILDNPLPVGVACETARAWLRQPYVSVLHPGDRHAEIVFGLLELHSTDRDFGRFAGLRWTNPLG